GIVVISYQHFLIEVLPRLAAMLIPQLATLQAPRNWQLARSKFGLMAISYLLTAFYRLAAPAFSGFSALLADPLRIPRISSSFMMSSSSPSILISDPEYLPNRTRSPSLTARGTVWPFSNLPVPTAMTTPSW